MPIRPDLKAMYPPDWPEISRRVRFTRAGGRCEVCARPHGRMVFCLPDGRWYDAAIGVWISGHGLVVEAPARNDLMAMRVVRVVLTCAHLNHDPANSADVNLGALCSRCHMLHDAPHHYAQRRITLRSRWALADLFDGPYSLVGYPRNV